MTADDYHLIAATLAGFADPCIPELARAFAMILAAHDPAGFDPNLFLTVAGLDEDSPAARSKGF